MPVDIHAAGVAPTGRDKVSCAWEPALSNLSRQIRAIAFFASSLDSVFTCHCWCGDCRYASASSDTLWGPATLIMNVAQDRTISFLEWMQTLPSPGSIEPRRLYERMRPPVCYTPVPPVGKQQQCPCLDHTVHDHALPSQVRRSLVGAHGET